MQDVTSRGFVARDVVLPPNKKNANNVAAYKSRQAKLSLSQRRGTPDVVVDLSFCQNHTDIIKVT